MMMMAVTLQGCEGFPNQHVAGAEEDARHTGGAGRCCCSKHAFCHPSFHRGLTCHLIRLSRGQGRVFPLAFLMKRAFHEDARAWAWKAIGS